MCSISWQAEAQLIIHQTFCSPTLVLVFSNLYSSLVFFLSSFSLCPLTAIYSVCPYCLLSLSQILFSILFLLFSVSCFHFSILFILLHIILNLKLPSQVFVSPHFRFLHQFSSVSLAFIFSLSPCKVQFFFILAILSQFTNHLLRFSFFL